MRKESRCVPFYVAVKRAYAEIDNNMSHKLDVDAMAVGGPSTLVQDLFYFHVSSLSILGSTILWAIY